MRGKMRKICLLILTTGLFAAGCGNKETAAQATETTESTLETAAFTPDVIIFGEERMSYLDAGEDVPEIFSEPSVKVVINKEDKIRCLDIYDKNIITYQNISVGDTLEKVLETIPYAMSGGGAAKGIYSAMFDGTTNLDFSKNKEARKDDFIWINYYFNENNILNRIMIFDEKYGRILK